MLIKTIANAVPQYAMSVVLLPSIWCQHIDSMARNFLWGNCTNDKCFTPASWTTVCKPKGAGGLGIRNIKDINLALL